MDQDQYQYEYYSILAARRRQDATTLREWQESLPEYDSCGVQAAWSAWQKRIEQAEKDAALYEHAAQNHRPAGR